jgi:hypothetical protein
MLQNIERQRHRFAPYTNYKTAISITRKTIKKFANISINTNKFVANYFSQTRLQLMETIDEETLEELNSNETHIVKEFIDDYFSADHKIDINEDDYDMVPEYRINIRN